SLYDNTDNSAVDVRTYTGGLDILNNGVGTANTYSLIRLGTWGASGVLSSHDGSFIQSKATTNNEIDLTFGRYLSTGEINNYMTIKNGGNVGIGTTAPGAKLELSATSGTNRLKITNTGTLVSDQSSLELNANSQSWQFYVKGNVNQMGIWSTTLGNDVMSFLSTGNVGIGTTGPNYKLDVNGTANAYDFKINGTSALTSETNWNANYSTFLTHITWANVMNGTLALNSTFGNYFTKSDILGFSYYNSTTLPSRVSGSGTAWYIPMWNGTTSLNNSVIFQNGSNIGIGTTIPTSKLEVAGTFNATSNGGTLQVDSSGNVNIGL
ncbi:hypothetical protein COV77_04190, partial [Candidatus Pacearchaeota archaeon CG11_big_fil_rev_8_21_14_0_20_30_13]